MSKFSKTAKLSNEKRLQLLLFLCEAIRNLNTEEEIATFLTDLLTPQELEMLSKRLYIAQKLLQNKKYEEIKKELKVSFSTIGRIATWLNISGSGFKLIINRSKHFHHTKSKKVLEMDGLYNLKRRYSQYYWPQLLIEKMLKASDKKHQDKLITILSSMINNKKAIRDYPDIASKYKKG